MKRFNSLKSITNTIMYGFLIIFVLIPTLYILCVSFFSADALGNIHISFTVENYKKILNPIYLDVLLNSVKISLLTTIFTIILAYPLALIVSKCNRNLRQILFMLIIIPYWTNSLVRTYSILFIFRADGIINQLLMCFNIIKKPMQLLYTEGAVIFTMVYLFLPVMFLPVFTSVEKINPSFAEASFDLGAGKFSTFCKITFPLTLPGLFAGSVLVFTPCLGLFFISDLIGGGKTVLLGNIIKDQFSATRNLPFGSSLSVIMMLISFIFIGVYFKVSQSDSRGSSI